MKLALFGFGRMGRAVREIAEARGHEVTAALDDTSNPDASGVTDSGLNGARMAIDFSVAEAVEPNVRKAAALGVNVVVGTTGWESSRAEIESIVSRAGTGLLWAPNFSVGMLLFRRIVRVAAKMVDRLDDYDVHLWEAHHRHKTDHPGGTARALADDLVSALRAKTGWSTELSEGWSVDPATLQVSVARVGEVPGVHGVGIDGPDDRIELEHRARSRTGFARGAVLAAEWLEGRAGVYTMDDLMDELLGASPTDGEDT